MGGKLGEELRGDRLAIEPLLQHAERLHLALAHDQQFAVERAVEGERVDEIGKGVRNVFAGARIEARDAPSVGARSGDRLDADAVPFPFRDIVRRVELGEVARLDRMREHGRAERGGIGDERFFRPAFDPGEEIEIRRRERRPENLDLVGVLAAERRHRGFREPRRDADAQRAGDEFQERPSPRFVEGVEPARELRRQLGLAEPRERRDHVREGGRFLRPLPGGERSTERQRGRVRGRWPRKAVALGPPSPGSNRSVLADLSPPGRGALLGGHSSATVSERSPT